ncbi:MAG: DUF4349 domain-containing protein, partial [Acidimicrobiales bacterium]
SGVASAGPTQVHASVPAGGLLPSPLAGPQMENGFTTAGPSSSGAAGSSLVPTAVGQPAKVVQTASLDLAYAKGRNARARYTMVLDRVNALASGSGGFVAAEQTAQDQAAPRATATLRVPTAAFQTVLQQLAGLARVRSESTSGKDVTAQYVDLQARIAALTLTRDQFDAILAKATSTPDILAVEAQIGDVQSQLEQLQGQQKVLVDQTTYATINLTLSQAGAGSVLAPPSSSSGLGHAWHQAVSGFVGGFEDVVAGSGTVLFAILALVVGVGVVALVGRLIWTALRRRLV